MSIKIIKSVLTTGTPKRQFQESTPIISTKQDSKSDNIIRLDIKERQDIANSKAVNKNVSDIKSTENANNSINKLNNSAQIISRNLEFHIDNISGRTVITVRDNGSKEVIRQIPMEEQVRVAENIRNYQEGNSAPQGLIIDDFIW